MKYFAVLLSLLYAFSVSGQGNQQKGSLVSGGLQRTFVIYIPGGMAATQKPPVVISLHGALSNGSQMMNFADFKPIAEREKFLVVCPDGIERRWNDGRDNQPGREGVNDVQFISQLIDYVVNNYNGDAKRVYVTGISNGGFMCTRLACELSNKIAAVAPVSGTMAVSVNYHPVRAVPVMYIHGTKDPLVPYEGGQMRRTGATIYSHEQMVKMWADTDHCNPTPSIANLPDSAGDGTTIVRKEYSNPQSGIKVVSYTINDGGHTWPDGPQYLPRLIVGKVSHNLNACEVIWQFFKGYTLP